VVTSQAVLLEIGNAMAKVPTRGFGVRLLEKIHRDPAIDVVSITDDLYREAFAAYRSRLDKEWGLVDCMSFVIMQRLGIREALTADRHFEQAGFRALMRPPP
jgi:predicted nucleic acid-binding protein